MFRKREVAAALGFALLAGCPQLLEDGFQNVPLGADVLHGARDGGTFPVGGSGGNHGAGAGGASSGASGAAGSNVAGFNPVGSRPSVVSTVPTDGERGVEPDAELVFTFSTPMNTSSIEAAYVSSELPAALVSFRWSDDDTVLAVHPNAPLRVSSGSSTAGVQAASYVVDLTSAAKDKAGRALMPAHVNFTVLRSITQELEAVRDRDLTGNWRDDGSYGSLHCERADTTFCIGDGAGTYKAFLTFDLDALPTDVVSISAAELSSTVQEISGAPFSALGALKLEHVEFSAIGGAAYSAAARSAPKIVSTASEVGERLSSDVLSEIEAVFRAQSRAQFRLAFDVDTNSDAIADQIVCDWSSAGLSLTYRVP